MSSLSEIELKNLTEALTQNATKGIDSEIHNLYGAIDDLRKIQKYKDILNSPITISKIYEIHNAEMGEKRKQEKAIKYSKDLFEYLKENNNVDLNGEYIAQIRIVLAAVNKKEWDKKLKLFFDSNNIKYDQNITFDDAFLFSLNKEETILKIGNIESKEFLNYELFELKSFEELEKESAELGHCAGKSDFYINKIRNGKIKVFALRENNKSK